MTIPTVTEVLVVNGTRIETERLRRNLNNTWFDVPVRIGPHDTAFFVALTAPYRTTTLALPEGNPP